MIHVCKSLDNVVTSADIVAIRLVTSVDAALNALASSEDSSPALNAPDAVSGLRLMPRACSAFSNASNCCNCSTTP